MINPLTLLAGKAGLYAALGVMVLSMATCTGVTLGIRGELKATEKQLAASGRQLDTAKKARAHFETELATCNANYTDLKGASLRQEAAVQALKAEGDRLTAVASKAVSDARRAQASADRSATALLNYKAVGANQCERTADAIRKAKEALK